MLSVFLQLMALLLLRHALIVGDADEDEDDISTFFTVSNTMSFKSTCYFL